MPHRTAHPKRLLPVAAALALLGAAPPAHAARAVYFNGRIFTSDPSAPWAQGLAVEDDKIIAVGTNEQVLNQGGGGARRYDLGGRTVIPGFNDAHVHVLVPLGNYLNAPNFLPGPGPTLNEVLALLDAGAATSPPGSPLYAFVGSAFADDPLATRFTLDAVAPGHPIALFMWSGHGTWLNSVALADLGIAEDQPDPFGGFFVRVPGTAIITGEAHEYAEYRIRRALFDRLPDAALSDFYRGFAARAIQWGYTSIQDMAVGLTHERALSVINAAALPVRVRSICFPLSPDEACESGKSGSVNASGIKWISDGTPVERLAYLNGTYADRPGTRGNFNLDGALPGILARSHNASARHSQALFHAVGDGAIDRILDGLGADGGGNAWGSRRTRIEHGDLLFAPDFARARDLGVVIVQNATHFALAATFAARFDGETFSQLEPMRSLLDQGIPLALGTDGIGQPFNPFVDLFLATIHPTHPSEALTLEQAVIAYTRGSAYAEFEENRKGTLAPGKLADFAVLSQDIFSVPPPALPATVSLLTVVGGNAVWDAGVIGAE